MRLEEIFIFINLAYLSVKDVVLSENVILVPSVIDARENASLTFHCSNDGHESFSESRWTFSKESVDGIIALKNGSCDIGGFLTNTSLYACNCDTNGSYSVVLKKVDRKQNGAFWICRQGNMGSNIVYITVTVPVAMVEIKRPTESFVSLQEHSCVTFQCHTSYSSPKPTVTWLFHKNTSDNVDDEEIVDGVVQSSTSNLNGLVSTTATLVVQTNKTMDGWGLYCLAYNTLHQNVKSRFVSLNVTYMVKKESKTTFIVFGALSLLLLLIALAAVVTAIRRGRKLSKMKHLTNVREDKDKLAVSRQYNVKMPENRASYEKLDSISGPLYDVPSFTDKKEEKPAGQAYANLELSFITGNHTM